MITHSSILAWKIPQTERTGRLQFVGLQRVRHDRVTECTHTHTCICIYQYIYVCVCVYIYIFTYMYVCTCSVAQSHPNVCDLMDCSPPGSSVHGISQARILEWVIISSSKESSPAQGSNLYLLHWQADSLPLSHLESPLYIALYNKVHKSTTTCRGCTHMTIQTCELTFVSGHMNARSQL